MTEINTSRSKRPSVLRVLLAITYFAGLLYLFHWSWRRFIVFLWAIIDLHAHRNMSLIDLTKAWTANSFIWLLLAVTAAKFVFNLFSSRRPLTVLTRQTFSAAVMMIMPDLIYGLDIAYGINISLPWDTSYSWLPEGALLPVIAAIALVALGSIGLPDFVGYPLYRFFPRAWRRKVSSWMTELLAMDQSIGGPKRWGRYGGYASLTLLQSMRTLLLIYIMPLAFGIALLWTVGFVFFSLGASNRDPVWHAVQSRLPSIYVALIPVFIITLIKNRGHDWRTRGLWTVGLVLGYGALSMGHDPVAIVDLSMIVVPMIIAAISAFVVAWNTSKENWGSSNDVRFVGIAVTVPDACELYASMCFRMLKPYGVSLIILVLPAFEWVRPSRISCRDARYTTL